MASIFKERDKWRVSVSLEGKRKTKSFGTRKEAQDWLSEFTHLQKTQKNINTNFTVEDM